MLVKAGGRGDAILRREGKEGLSTDSRVIRVRGGFCHLAWKLKHVILKGLRNGYVTNHEGEHYGDHIVVRGELPYGIYMHHADNYIEKNCHLRALSTAGVNDCMIYV